MDLKTVVKVNAILLKYFLHLRIKLSRSSNVNAYPLLPVLFLTMGKFLNKHSDEIERTDKITLRFFSKIVSGQITQKSNGQMRSPENKKCSPYKVFGINHPQTL